MNRLLMIASWFLSASVAAQTPPAIRQIGRLEHATTDSLVSAGPALQMTNGSVLVHDGTGRRVLLFDSTLLHSVVVADTTDRTSRSASCCAIAAIPRCSWTSAACR